MMSVRGALARKSTIRCRRNPELTGRCDLHRAWKADVVLGHQTRLQQISNMPTMLI
jgi:hypothetical protein